MSSEIYRDLISPNVLNSRIPSALTRTLPQELGIDFDIISVSEPCRAYREFCLANHENIAHVHLSMADQIHGAACERHCHAENCVIHCEPMLAVLGTPCPPFSVQRAKRFKAGTVQQHKAYKTTFESALLFLETFNPVTAVLEQVTGFDQFETAGDTMTPLGRHAPALLADDVPLLHSYYYFTVLLYFVVTTLNAGY